MTTTAVARTKIAAAHNACRPYYPCNDNEDDGDATNANDEDNNAAAEEDNNAAADDDDDGDGDS